ncbi:hypothetical protein [Magnetofaba australis]|uniref:hypothetical protein n=1 Tax=Magnetofaba australis TaxID=1472297 RepID=UPI000A19B6F9|nr:hypothetical protein [Magnetofaba australis]
MNDSPEISRISASLETLEKRLDEQHRAVLARVETIGDESNLKLTENNQKFLEMEGRINKSVVRLLGEVQGELHKFTNKQRKLVLSTAVVQTAIILIVIIALRYFA